MEIRISPLLALVLGLVASADDLRALTVEDLDKPIEESQDVAQPPEAPAPALAPPQATAPAPAPSPGLATAPTEATATAGATAGARPGAAIAGSAASKAFAAPKVSVASANAFFFPSGSQAFRRPDRTLQITSPEGVTTTFSAGSRAFRLPDGSLNVVAPALASPSAASALAIAAPSATTPVVQDRLKMKPGRATGPEAIPSAELPAVRTDFDNNASFNLKGKDGSFGGLALSEATGKPYYLAGRVLAASLTGEIGDTEVVGDDSLDDFAGVSLAFGRRLNDKWSVEIEGAYATASKGGNDATTLQGFVNALYSIPIAERTSLFAGGGTGVLHYKEDFEYRDYYTDYYYTTSYEYSYWYGYRPVRTRHSYRQYYTAEGSGEAFLVAINATAGLSFAITPTISLDVALRYITTLEGDFKSDEVDDADVRIDFICGYAGLRIPL